MWILTFTPDWVFHLILTIGVVGTIASLVLGFIPFIKQYKIAIQVVSLLVLSLGLYLEGGLADYKEWEAKVKDLEAKIAVAEEKSKTVNTVVEEKIVEKTKVVKEKGKDIIKYVDRDVIKNQEVIKYVENCPIPQEIINVHNQAASMNTKEEKK
jgi:hypothetical protein